LVLIAQLYAQVTHLSLLPLMSLNSAHQNLLTL